MCGFAGLTWKDSFDPSGIEQTVEKMIRTVHHRGPDSDGHISTMFARIGFKRLSIIDLETGDQPASNETGSIKVFLNGEIYNYRQLRESLEAKGHRFHTKSDTEVLPHLYEEYGIDFVQHLNGMFAICICDIEKELLCLCRDRIGIKPLYYAPFSRGMLFSSEIKALLASGLIARELDTASILPLIDLFYCPGPHTLIKGVKKLLPGQLLVLGPRCEPNIRQYYELRVPVESEAWAPDLNTIDHLLSDSVGLRMSADVPVGISLSGGLDSSVVSMYAARTANSDVTAFTVQFENTVDEEVRCACAVAKKLGLKHVILSPSIGDFMTDFVRMVWFCDEPVADPAFYAAMKVAETAASVVKVLLSGTGGDELFAGYYHYWLNRKQRVWTSLPRWFTSSNAARLACSLLGRANAWSALETFRDSRLSWHYKAMSNLNVGERELLRRHIPASRDPSAALGVCFQKSSECDPVNQQLYADVCTYLPDQLLTVLDRTTMSVSIEGRVPFLDHRLGEALFQIRGDYKLGNGRQFKALLKMLGRNWLPREVIRRRKAGFPTGVLNWISRDLAPVLERLFFTKDTLVTNYLPIEWVGGMCRSSEAIYMNARKLYSLLVLQIWYELFIKRSISTPPDTSLLEMFDIKYS